jgi:hypothetical protein
MKKTALVAMAAVVMFSFSSCVKKHTCECTDSTDNSTTSTEIETAKAAAKVACEAGTMGTITCKLK